MAPETEYCAHAGKPHLFYHEGRAYPVCQCWLRWHERDPEAALAVLH